LIANRSCDETPLYGNKLRFTELEIVGLQDLEETENYVWVSTGKLAIFKCGAAGRWVRL